MWQTLINNSGAVIAVFTVVLAVTTIIYVVVTAKLLKQSKNAFLADIVLRMVRMCWKDLKETRKEKEGKEKVEEFILVKAWMEGYCKTFVKIDKKLGMDIDKLLNVYSDAVVKEWEKGEKELKEKEEEARRESEKVRK